MKLSMFRSNKGAVMIIFAAALVALLGFGAIVVDIGTVAVEKQKFQNAVDSAALAAAFDLPDTDAAIETANHYIQLNGYDASDITIEFEDSGREISITGTKQVNYTLAKTLGFDNATIHPAAAATSDKIGGAFDDVLFSGSRTAALILNGSNQLVDGSSHTNKNFVANGSYLTITGACEALTTITVHGSSIDISNRVPNASFVEMPDFSETIRLQAESAGQVYNGNKTFNGSYIDVDEPIYVNGNVTVNGSHFRGKGCILATGNITFNGSNLNESSDDAICFYSQNGNIVINGSNAVFDGILYAPAGKITMNGSNQTINGRVIGNSVLFNGSGLSIIGGSSELSSLPSGSVKLVR